MDVVQDYKISHNGKDAQGCFQTQFQRLLDNVASVMVTSPQNIRLALLGLFAQGHLLLEDLPGVGKTLLAKAIAASITGKFSRIQFTSDLLPGDITGTSVFDLRNQTFEFMPGPIFANVVLADELNRANPRTQSALLEAMAEGQVSAEGDAWSLPRPFFIIATQNSIETQGNFLLPNSQLDRFMIAMPLGLPTPTQELEILQRAEHGLSQVAPVLTAAEVTEMQEFTLRVEVATSVKQYIVNLAAASREQSDINVGVSPRGSASLLRASQVWAAFADRTFVLPEDVQELAPYIWGHRLVLGASEEDAGFPGQKAISRLIESVTVPL